MAINPFPRIQGLEIPTALPSGARAPEGTFANLASIGDAIGEYRNRNQMAEILRGAVDPTTGALDMNKAATAIALSGRDPVKYLSLMEAARGRTTSEAAQKALEAHYNRQATETERANRAREEAERLRIEQGREFQIDDPLGVGPPRRFKTLPDGTVQQLYPPPSKTPGPQSELEIPDAAKYAAAGSDARLPAQFYPPEGGPATPNQGPEEQPPYQVAQAGPLTVAPSIAKPAAAAAAPDREAALQRFAQENSPEAAAIFRDILDYKRGLPTEDKLRQKWITAARTLDPTFDPNKFDQEKKRPTVSAEMEARLGMAGKFLADMEDVTDANGRVIPGIRSRVAAGEMNKDYTTATAAQFGKGGPGEVRRLIDDGAEALVRMLTGAGMNKEEVAQYERRYQFSFRENPTETLSKIDNLKTVLRAVQHAVETGKNSPEELRKVLGERQPSAFAKPEVKKVTNDAEANTALREAGDALKDPRVTEGNRAAVLKAIHERLREKGIPPRLWPQ